MTHSDQTDRMQVELRCAEVLPQGDYTSHTSKSHVFLFLVVFFFGYDLTK